MLQFQEFSAWITVEDEEALEFSVEVLNDEKRVCCWIPSEIGKTFKVHWKDSVVGTATAGWVFVDGNKWGGQLIEDAVLNTAISSGYSQSATDLCPYTFAKVDLTDDDAFLVSSVNAVVGVIELNIARVEVLGHVPFAPVVPPLRLQAVHERSKKGADHQVQLGEAIPQASTHNINVRTINDSVVKFVFKYRPIGKRLLTLLVSKIVRLTWITDVLRANGIAPQRPRETKKRKASDGPDDEVEVGDVKPAANDNDVLDLTGENSDELKQLNQRRIGNTIKPIKRQHASKKKVKRESDTVKRERLAESDEVIDLTQ